MDYDSCLTMLGLLPSRSTGTRLTLVKHAFRICSIHIYPLNLSSWGPITVLRICDLLACACMHCVRMRPRWSSDAGATSGAICTPQSMQSLCTPPHECAWFQTHCRVSLNGPPPAHRRTKRYNVTYTYTHRRVYTYSIGLRSAVATMIFALGACAPRALSC